MRERLGGVKPETDDLLCSCRRKWKLRARFFHSTFFILRDHQARDYYESCYHITNGSDADDAVGSCYCWGQQTLNWSGDDRSSSVSSGRIVEKGNF